MHPTPQALVSIVTPVHNGEKYLQECIESVLAQTYTNWEYLIVNNCSTDRTLEIAQSYAEKHPSIHLLNNEQFLSSIQNHNNSLRKISPESKYCKMLHADDLLLPDCITKMVELAEQHPSVGVVGSYYIGDNFDFNIIPYPKTVISGREISRACLLLKPNERILGIPTTTLIRTDLIRSRDPFYNESNLGSDKEALYDILQESDFGFVHQVLTYFRLHGDQITQHKHTRTILLLSRIFTVKKYGPLYLTNEEYTNVLNKAWNQYYHYLARNVFLLYNKQVRSNIKRVFDDLECSFSISRLLNALFSYLVDLLLNPKSSAEKLMRRISKGDGKCEKS